MKILYGITKANFGGAQRYVFDLAKAMKKRGHNVAVLCGEGGVLADKLKEEGIRVIEIKGMKRDISLVNEFRSFYFIFRTLWNEKPNIFHTNSSKMGGIGNLAARLAGIKRIIFTGHGWAFNESWRPWWQKVFIKLLAWLTITLSHKTLCVSKKTKNDISWMFIKNKLNVVYNGIENFELLPRTEPGFTVGAISELHKIKGLDVLLNAWAKFRKNHEAKLIIFGDGEEKENLQNLAQNLGILESVEFRGFVKDAKTYLNNFDIFVMPSRSENMPYALLEAGISGRPVIASAVGGIPEIVESGVSGELVEPEDPEALFSSLALFHDNPRTRDRLGESLRKTVREKFSLERMVIKTLEIYL